MHSHLLTLQLKKKFEALSEKPFLELTSCSEHQPYSHDASKLPTVPLPPPQIDLENLKHFPSCRVL
jgi:hypothetical protein